MSFPDYKHGIFRFFDVQDPNDSHVRLIPHGITVTRDGQAEPFEILREGKGRYRNVKIGSAYTTMTGAHTYVIHYFIDDALGATDKGRADFYWNLIGAGWRMPIQASRLTVHLPASFGPVKCAVGQGASSGCTAKTAGNGFVVRTGALDVNTPVTVRTTLDMAAPSRDRMPWPQRFDPVFGGSPIGAILLLAIALFAGFMGMMTARGTRERNPQYPLMYAPPDGIGPAQAKYLFTETIGKDAFVASIMQTAEKGATTLDHSDGWTITDTGQAAGWQQLDPVSAYAAQVLGVPGGSFTANTSVSAGKKLKSALSKFDDSVRGWARQNGLMTAAGLGSFGGVLVILAILLTLFLGIINPIGLSVLALIPGLFAVFTLELLAPGSSTRRTAADGSSGRGSAGSAGCSRRRPARSASTSPGARSSTPPTSRGRWRSGSPRSGRRSTSSRPVRSRRFRRTSAPATATPAAASPRPWPTTSPRPSARRSPPTRPPRARRRAAAGAAASPAVAGAAAEGVAPGEPLHHNQASVEFVDN